MSERTRIRRIALVGCIVAMAAVWGAGPAAAGGGGCHAEPLTDRSAQLVGIKDFCFTPTILRVQPGDTVTWVNGDPTDHTVTGANDSWGSYDPIASRKLVKHRFDKAGIYPYFCMLHPGMVGVVVVGDGNASAASASIPVSDVDTGTTPVAQQAKATEATGSAAARSSSSMVWRTTTLVLLGLFLVMVGFLVFRRTAAWRSGLEVRAG
jgi:plastocyanin